MLPEAALVGLAGRDGLSVEMLVRHEPTFPQPLEVELADLTSEASRVAAALGAGPLLTVAFQAGDDHLLLSPVGEEHFAYLLTPSDSPADFRRAQAVLLQAVSRIHELF
jgi:predicted regulator of Ras-like GTPase activity (Roadblock/LC7/MglB family)